MDTEAEIKKLKKTEKAKMNNNNEQAIIKIASTLLTIAVLFIATVLFAETKRQQNNLQPRLLPSPPAQATPTLQPTGTASLTPTPIQPTGTASLTPTPIQPTGTASLTPTLIQPTGTTSLTPTLIQPTGTTSLTPTPIQPTDTTPIPKNILVQTTPQTVTQPPLPQPITNTTKNYDVPIIIAIIVIAWLSCVVIAILMLKPKPQQEPPPIVVYPPQPIQHQPQPQQHTRPQTAVARIITHPNTKPVTVIVNTGETPANTGETPANTGENEVEIGAVGEPLTFTYNGRNITVTTPFIASSEPTADEIAAVKFLVGIKDEKGRGVSQNFVIRRLFNSRGKPQSTFIKKCLTE